VGTPKNPNLDMTLQAGWIFVSPDRGKRAMVCNWCMREHYYNTKFFAPISIDLEDHEPQLVCDMCNSALEEGPALGGKVNVMSEQEGKSAVSFYVDDGGTLGIHQHCFEKNPEMAPVIKTWEAIRAGAKVSPEIAAINCIVCSKELSDGTEG